MQRFRYSTIALALTVIMALVLSACEAVQLKEPMAGAEMEPMMEEHTAIHDTAFTRHAADAESPSGNSVAVDCQDPSADYPYTPYDWPDASAMLEVMQVGENSMVSIDVMNAKPETYYTIWLRLGGTDSSGNPFGGNPLTDGKATALAPSSDLPNLVASTGEGNGNDQQPNGFYTDADGNASYSITLDFPLNGAYPFQKFDGFDPMDERLPAENPMIHPVAVVGPNGPYTLRIVSHCTDGVGHGLTSGAREWWFDWRIES